MAKTKAALQNEQQILRELDRVFDIEIEALRAVSKSVAGNFVAAVRAISLCRGRVIVTGIGKSGIIANKIAATLTSTGTPAFFVHAAEALHGDLGVIATRDIVIAIGKSGESQELHTLLPIVKKLGATVIAITASPNSRMAKGADIVLPLDIPREACPLNLAPTSSTTASLVLGDAIAVALMKLKNISTEDFAMRHPAGQLGKRLLLQVQDVMRSGERNPMIGIDESVKHMLVLITAGQAGAISVLEKKGGLAGLVSDYDVRKAMENTDSIFALKIRDIMNPKPMFIYEDQLAADALETMRSPKKPVAALPVLNRGQKVVGMVHIWDLLSAGL